MAAPPTGSGIYPDLRKLENKPDLYPLYPHLPYPRNIYPKKGVP
jgi:hypothetical protein